MYYKIIRITDKKFNEKTDEKSVNRIGRVIKFCPLELVSNAPVFLECVHPGAHKSLLLSPLVDYDLVDRKAVEWADFDLVIETLNSFYYFDKWFEEEHEGELNDG